MGDDPKGREKTQHAYSRQDAELRELLRQICFITPASGRCTVPGYPAQPSQLMG